MHVQYLLYYFQTGYTVHEYSCALCGSSFLYSELYWYEALMSLIVVMMHRQTALFEPILSGSSLSSSFSPLNPLLLRHQTSLVTYVPHALNFLIELCWPLFSFTLFRQRQWQLLSITNILFTVSAMWSFDSYSWDSAQRIVIWLWTTIHPLENIQSSLQLVFLKEKNAFHDMHTLSASSIVYAYMYIVSISSLARTMHVCRGAMV